MENFDPEVMQLKDEWIKMFQTARKKKSTINKIRQFLIQIIDSKCWFKRECNFKLVLTFLKSFFAY